MDLQPYQLEEVCAHVGHTMDIHKLHYKNTSGFIERVNIGKIMMLQELELVGKFAGKKLEDVDITGK